MYRCRLAGIALAFAIVGCGGAGGGAGGGGAGTPGGPPVPVIDENGGAEPLEQSSFSTSPCSGDFTYNGIVLCGECVHAVRVYYQARYGIAVPYLGASGCALDFWALQDGIPGMSKIPFDGVSRPLADDLLVWDGRINLVGTPACGHVAIMVQSLPDGNIEVADSNWKGDGVGRQHNVRYDNRLLGWFRPGGSMIFTTSSIRRYAFGSDDMNFPRLSYDGRFLAYLAAVSGQYGKDVIVVDRLTGTYRIASVGTGGAPVGNGPNGGARISGDGQFVAFWSNANNLVPSDGNGVIDVFLQQWLSYTNSTVRVSTSAAHGDANGQSSQAALSRSGDLVAFTSAATNIVSGPTGAPYQAFLYRRADASTRALSLGYDGQLANGNCNSIDVSGDASTAIFTSSATNLSPGASTAASRMYVWNVGAAAITTVYGPPTFYPSVPRISGNGRYVVDVSASLVRLDVTNGATVTVLSFLVATPSDWDVSNDGNFVVYATNVGVVGDDTNGKSDVFVFDVAHGTTRCVSRGPSDIQADGDSVQPSISGDGRWIAFRSTATNLAPDDNGTRADAFVVVNPLNP